MATADEEQVDRQFTLLIRRVFRSLWTGTYGPEDELDQHTFPFLLVLVEEGPMRVSELARYFRLDKSTVSRHLSRLEGAGLVETRPDPSDGRAGLLRVTRRGRARVQSIRDTRKAPVRRVLASWSAEDRAGLGALLERLNTDLEEELGSPTP